MFNEISPGVDFKIIVSSNYLRYWTRIYAGELESLIGRWRGGECVPYRRPPLFVVVLTVRMPSIQHVTLAAGDGVARRVRTRDIFDDNAADSRSERNGPAWRVGGQRRSLRDQRCHEINRVQRAGWRPR